MGKNMTQTEDNVAKVKAGPNVYTVLMIVAVVALWVGIFFAAGKLTGQAPAGYDMSVGDLFSPAQESGEATRR